MLGAWQMCVERYGECMLREWRNNARSRTREVECEERNHANNLNQAVDDLVSAILESDVYLTYRTELDKVKQVPGLKSQIDEFRMRNFALQSSMDNDFDNNIQRDEPLCSWSILSLTYLIISFHEQINRPSFNNSNK